MNLILPNQELSIQYKLDYQALSVLTLGTPINIDPSFKILAYIYVHLMNTTFCYLFEMQAGMKYSV